MHACVAGFAMVLTGMPSPGHGFKQFAAWSLLCGHLALRHGESQKVLWLSTQLPSYLPIGSMRELSCVHTLVALMFFLDLNGAVLEVRDRATHEATSSSTLKLNLGKIPSGLVISLQLSNI